MSVRGILENTEDNAVYHKEDIWITKISATYCSALMETHSSERNTHLDLELSVFCWELFHLWCIFPSHLSHQKLSSLIPPVWEAVPCAEHGGLASEPSPTPHHSWKMGPFSFTGPWQWSRIFFPCLLLCGAQSKLVYTSMHCGCILGLQINTQKLFTYTDGFQTRIFSL